MEELEDKLLNNINDRFNAIENNISALSLKLDEMARSKNGQHRY